MLLRAAAVIAVVFAAVGVAPGGSVDAGVTLPPPQVIINCPGYVARTKTCADTPVRVQFLVDSRRVAGIDLTSAGCDSGMSTGTGSSTGTGGTSGNGGDPNAGAGGSGGPQCVRDNGVCFDGRDCCSFFCNFADATEANRWEGKCGQEPAHQPPQGGTTGGGSGDQSGVCRNNELGCRTNAECCSDWCDPVDRKCKPESQYTSSCKGYGDVCRLDADCCGNAMICAPQRKICRPRPPSSRRALRTSEVAHTGISAPLAPRRLAAVTSGSSKTCRSPADCESFRCINGVCDDGVGSGFVGGDGCNVDRLEVLYTISLDPLDGVGPPSRASNDRYTQLAEPGEFVDLPFGGTLKIFAMASYCDDVNCTDSTVSVFPFQVQRTGISASTTDISQDALPAQGEDRHFIRSAVRFDRFDGGASRFNSTAFAAAVADALNTDRKMYSPGVPESEAPEEFSEIPRDAVEIILVDPLTSTVQYEVRVSEADSPAVRARLLHSYYKYPLAMLLGQYGVLGATPDDEVRRISIDSENSIVLEPEEVPPMSTRDQIRQLLGPGGIAAIVVSIALIILGFVVIAYRTRRLQRRERLLRQKLRSLNAQSKKLQQEQQDLENERRRLEQEAIQAERAAEEAARANNEANAQQARDKAKKLRLAVQKRVDQIRATQQKVSEIQATAEQQRIALENETQARKAQGHARLQERLRKKNKKRAKAAGNPGSEVSVTPAATLQQQMPPPPPAPPAGAPPS